MSAGTGSRVAGVVAALAILLLGTVVYQWCGPAADPELPEEITATTPAPTPIEPETPAPVVEEETAPRDDLRILAAEDGALTAGALDLPRMGALAVDDEGYDPVIEARQIFHPFEQTLLDADPLDPDTWRAAQEQHALRNEGALRRADFLRRSGHPEEARELMLEWSRLNGIWQARAYGRPHRPGGEPGE